MYKEHYLSNFKEFLCIGKDRAGKRFRMCYSNYFHARCINMWQGNLWGVTHDGRRVLLNSTRN